MSPVWLSWNPTDDIDTQVRASLGKPATRELLNVLTRTETEREALIGHLRLRDDTAWFAELLTDLESDDVARLHVVEELRRVS
jgi:hypothetical protein